MPVRPKSSSSNDQSSGGSSKKKSGISMKERDEMRKERYKFSTGAQLEKARDRQDRENRDKVCMLLYIYTYS